MAARHWSWLWLGMLLVGPSWAAEVKVENAWVRATAPGQKVAGAFMDLTAAADMKLVGVESAAAGAAELHSMSMDRGVMVMRPVADIDLPRGRTVSLAPGGLHIMLIDLKGPLKEGERAPITLLLQGADGKRERMQVQVEALRAAARVHQHGHMH